jgi:hypothetical protein
MSAATNEPASSGAHPDITLAVYRVTATGERVQVRERHVVPADNVVPFTLAYPPCACPQCRTTGGHQ